MSDYHFFNVYLSSKRQRVKSSNVCGPLKAIIYIKDQPWDHVYSIFSSAILGSYVVDTTPCTVNKTKKLLFNGIEKLS